MAMEQVVRSHEILVPVDGVELPGMLRMPADGRAVVLFAHGSGSSRFSTRNNFVANELVKGGLGTLLFDLLTMAEAEERENVFDIPLLADRLRAVRRWVSERDDARSAYVGYFGASTGAAAALIAAAADETIGAVVSRGGRPDLAMAVLPQVVAPTLLIVGGADHGVLDLNRQAYEALACEKELAVVRGATHLFEEPGCLEEAADHARAWFVRHLLEAHE